MSSQSDSRSPVPVVIGYGNRLCGDDGVGPRVASAVGCRRPDVHALDLDQLTPELAAVVADAAVAVFVDARVDGGAGIEVRRLLGRAPAWTLDRVVVPDAVLSLAAGRYGRCPPAWTVSVPVTSVAFSEWLSPAARAAATEAVEVVSRLLPPQEASGATRGSPGA
jgi:hydrogenase maturation protease